MFPGQTHHLRNRRPVDVGIEQTNRRTFLRQRQRQIGRCRALADAPFAGGHSDDVLDAGQGLEGCLNGVRHDFDAHVRLDCRHARQRLQRRDHLILNRLDLRLGRIAQFDIERNLIAIDLDVLGGPA